MATTTVEVPLSDETRARLEEVAARTGTTEQETAATLIEGALAADDLEAEIIRKRLAEADAGGPFARHDQVLAWLRALAAGEKVPPRRRRSPTSHGGSVASGGDHRSRRDRGLRRRTKSGRRARNFAAALHHAASFLGDHPRMGRKGRVPATRELVVRRLPFVIAYRIRRSRVEVLRMIHGRRNWDTAFRERS